MGTQPQRGVWIGISMAMCLTAQAQDLGLEPVCSVEDNALGGRVCPDIADCETHDAALQVCEVEIPCSEADSETLCCTTSIPSPFAEGDCLGVTHSVPATVLFARDEGARISGAAPTLIFGHGYTNDRSSAGYGSDEATTDQATAFYENGYNVVAIDLRGHGESYCTSTATLIQPERDVADAQAVVDWIADQEWAETKQGDPVLGAIGGSYGGAIQLMTALVDPRIDAIAPRITWHDLTDSLAPNGVVRTEWVEIFHKAGLVFVNADPIVHCGALWAESTGEIPDGSNGSPNLQALTERGSLASHEPTLATPTLLAQSFADTLFNLNQAWLNYEHIQAAGGQVQLVVHGKGHQLPNHQQGNEDICGNLDEITLAFLDHHLRGDEVSVPDIRVGLDDDSCITSDEYCNLFDSELEPTPLGDVLVAQAALLPLFTAEDELVLAGFPRASGTLHTQEVALGSTAFFSLWVQPADPFGQLALPLRHLGDQVMPLRRPHDHDPSGHAFDFDLAGIATRLLPGDTLYLRIENSNEQFARSISSALQISGLEIGLPLAEPTPAEGCAEPEEPGPDLPTTLCHIPPGNPCQRKSKQVKSQGALEAHLGHGDTLGACTDSVDEDCHVHKGKGDGHHPDH